MHTHLFKSPVSAGAAPSPQSRAAPFMTDGVGRWVNEGGAGGELGVSLGVRMGVRIVRILVVEDDALIGELLSEMLIDMGFDVCAVAATEQAAVAEAALSRPDLLIVDANLSAGSGISAVRTITAAGPVAHLFTSGDAVKVKRLMPDSIVIQKPFDEAALSDAIGRALSIS